MPKEILDKKISQEQFLGVKSFLWEIIKVIFTAALIVVPVRIFLFQPFIVQGASMEPNFEDGQYLIINELGYKSTLLGSPDKPLVSINPLKKIKRGMVVVFHYPLDPSKFFIKRVIGLPGEKIEIKNSSVSIYNQDNPQGFALNEKEYLASGVKTMGEETIILKSDEYFVMGDNRMFSSDSRSWGPVKEKYITGEVLIRAWPPDKINLF